jgi:hypothetical protein
MRTLAIAEVGWRGAMPVPAIDATRTLERTRCGC